ncbi:hypothetical protein LJB42_000182 [Komagataella kurtzmanii]|nr:hypothetical protein LJB42_000182 [Komagataella kurtzmanii]
MLETVYQVPMECSSCVESVKNSLKMIPELEKLDINLRDNKVVVGGRVAPSQVVSQLQKIGKDAVIRGTGSPNSAAVCILESFKPEHRTNPVKGLLRMVAVSPSEMLIDFTVDGVSKAGTYWPSIRTSGNLTEGAKSTGSIFFQLQQINTTEKAAEGFKGQYFISVPLKITDLIGRSVVVGDGKGYDDVSDSSLVGVIARSAGVWENDKQVCSCTGKTVWQERRDVKDHGLTV